MTELFCRKMRPRWVTLQPHFSERRDYVRRKVTLFRSTRFAWWKRRAWE